MLKGSIMLNRRIALLVLLAVFSMANLALAQQEVWDCTFKGTFTEAGETGEFTWKVTWTGSEDTWLISGKTEESETKGTCNERTCKIEEKMIAGESKGKTFYWIGTYTDEAGKSDDTSITKFTGTWGPSPTDRKSSGTWKAKATCALRK
jgi:hypothetical protein